MPARRELQESSREPTIAAAMVSEASVVVVVVVVEFTLLTSILSGITWTVAYSEF